MDRQQPIFTETTSCRDCYKCVRECPVKAISVVAGCASVVGELCVLCGHCVEVCPAEAKKVRSDVERAKALLRLRPATILSLAPSFAAEFADWDREALFAALRGLGFAAVSETAIGADLVSREMGRRLAELGGRPRAADESPRVILSSACPVVVDYILKYRPALAGFLSGSCSPMIAHARWLKDRRGQEAAVVFAGPCIAKKREADRSAGDLEAAITFKGLRNWLAQAGLSPAGGGGPGKARPSPAAAGAGSAGGSHTAGTDREERASRGVLYPVDGGMIVSIKRQAPDLDAHFLSCSGMVEIERALDGIEEYRGELPVFMELLACEGGCVNGPRVERRSGSVAKRLSVLDYARGAAEEPTRGEVPLADARRAGPVAAEGFPEERLREALASVGKRERADELDCSGCGYDSCRAFAAALLSGRAERTMCVSWTRTIAEKKADALVRSMPSGVVVVDADLVVAECNANFARLLGPEAEALEALKPGLAGAALPKLAPFAELFAAVLAEGGPESIDRDLRLGNRILHASVFVIERGAFAGGVFQDVTVPWIRRDRVVAQAKSVIDKNLRTVQKIAYLLGENAADTETILESIIDSFSAEGEGEGR